MKNAHQIIPGNREEEFVREFDLREIDAKPPTFWTRRWWARMNAVLENVLRTIPSGSSILDVACANGNLTTMLGERGYRCVGLDLRHGFLTYAAKKDDLHRVSWVVGNALEPPFEPASFDAVIMGEVLEHVARPDQLIRAGLQLVKQDGMLICTTPNGACFRHSALPSYWEASRNPEDLAARQFGPAGENHLFALRPAELLSLVPGGEPARLQFAVSGLWNRLLSPFARFELFGAGIEWFSTRSVWRKIVCDTLVLVIRRTA